MSVQVLVQPEVVTTRVRMLGRFGVERGGRTVTDAGWRLRKARSLVKLLALAPQHRLHREQITASLWPDLDPTAAANNLYQTLHAARRMLDAPGQVPSCLQVRNEIVSLCADQSLWVDVEAFETVAARARRTHDRSSHRDAIALYAGDLLPDDPYEEWAAERRPGLRQEYLSLLADLAAIHEARGELSEAVEVLQQAVRYEPTFYRDGPR